MAVRSAIGAGHGRIVRQLLTESALLGMIAGAFGLVLARAGIAGLAALAPAYLPRLDAVALDLRAAGFAAAVSLLAGLLFGVAPALSLGRGRLARTLGSARSGSRSGSLLQSGMVVAEIALATVLLVGAGLLTRSFLRLNAVDPGFDAAGVVRLQLALDYGAFRTPEDQFDDAGVRARMDEIAAELRALPEVVDVAVSQSPPFSGYAANNNILPEGHEPQDGDFWLADRRFVTPGYFEVVGARLVEGRFLEPQDDRPDAASVVVITENIARRFWPGASAVGKRLGWWGQESIVVGVIEDVRDTSLADDPPMQFYAALAPFEQAGGSFLIGTRGAVEDLVTTVRNTTRRVAPNTPIMTLGRLDDAVAGSLDEARFRTRLIGLFALLAAILSVSGLYGVTSRAVAARVRELGVRVALGADRASVVGLVLRDGVRLAAIGALIGVAASIAGTRLLESFLYDIEPNDPLTLTLIVALVAGMAVLASLVPSLRASRVDPAEVLRAEA
jgi:predicted permease